MKGAAQYAVKHYKEDSPVSKKYFLLVMVLIALISGCSSMPGMPGYISEDQSSFDGSMQLSMEPAFVYRDNDGFSGSDLKLSLLWRSTMESDDIVLEAFVDGAHSFARDESLHFNVDGEVVSFQAIEQLTNIDYEPGVYSAAYVPGGNVSSKRYLVSREFITRILKASRVGVRLDLRRSFVEGVFSDTTTSSAHEAFKAFMQKVEQNPNLFNQTRHGDAFFVAASPPLQRRACWRR